MSRRSGEAAASRARQVPMAAAARVSRARRLRVEAGVQRRSTALFIGPGGVLGVRACQRGRESVRRSRPQARAGPTKWAEQADWAAQKEKNKEGRRFGPVGLGSRGNRREERRKGEGDWAGLKQGRGRKVLHLFENGSKPIQIKFNFREFKIKLKLKQLNNALQHECNTNRTTSFNLEINQYIFPFTPNSL